MKEMDDDQKFWQQVHRVLQIRVEEEEQGHPSSEDLVRYFEGTYRGDNTRAEVENHIRSCSACQQDLDAIRGTYPASSKSSKVFTLRSALDRISPFTIRYVLPIAAVLFIALVLFWNPSNIFYGEKIGPVKISESHPGGAPDSVSPGMHSLHVRKHLAITLLPQIPFRGPVTPKPIPRLTLEDDAPLIAVTLLIRRTDLPSAQLTMTLVTPEKKELPFAEKFSAVPSSRDIDTLRLTLDRDLFTKSSGVYKILLTEASPRDPDAPRQAAYSFEVVRTE